MKRKAGSSLYEMFRGINPTVSNTSGTQPQKSSKGVAGSGGKKNNGSWWKSASSSPKISQASSYDTSTSSKKPTFWEKYPIPKESKYTDTNKSRENFLNARGSIKYSQDNYNPTQGLEYHMMAEKALKDKPAGGWRPSDMLSAVESMANNFGTKAEFSYNTLYGDLRNYRAPRTQAFGGPKATAWVDKGQILQNLEDDKKRFLASLDAKQAAIDLEKFKAEEIKRRQEAAEKAKKKKEEEKKKNAGK